MSVSIYRVAAVIEARADLFAERRPDKPVKVRLRSGIQLLEFLSPERGEEDT